ncbi:MAG: SpoIIE family protein phosphatase [Spirochaetes bacterium]|nr:SpoIIE family protein phosphatase [Spirochaetota bacterium]
MHWYIIFYIAILMLAIVAYLSLAVYSFRHRVVVGAVAFSWFSSLGALGALAEGFSFLSATPELTHVWFNVRFVSLAFIPVVWGIFAIQYSGRVRWLNRARVALLCVIPVVTQIMIWTNDLHGLWVTKDAVAVPADHFMLMDTTARIPGPWFWVHSLYGYALLFLGVVLILQVSLGMVRFYRRQALVLGVGTLILTLGSMIPTFLPIPVLKFNPITLVLAISALMFGWAIFGYRFLDLVPVARSLLLESIDDAVIALDAQSRVLDLNPAMRKILAEGFRGSGRTLPDSLIGMPGDVLFEPWEDMARPFLGKTKVRTEISSTIRGTERHYDLLIAPLEEQRGGISGRIVLLHDITDRKATEKALREKTRTLGERVKELNCLFGISEIVRRPGISLDEIMQETAAIIPPAWQYPEITRSRITLNARSYCAAECVETRWRQAADIMVNGRKRGEVEVFYLEERDGRDEGPFLLEERSLIDAIAERLGRVVERRWAENDLRLSEARLDALHTMNNRKFASEKELIEYALEEEVRLTGSEIGYFHFVKEDGLNLELFAWSKKVMETCTAAADRHYPLNLAGIWADCVRQKRPVVHNDYQAIPDKKGYPEGHSHIIRHVSVPIFDGDRVMAVSGVANKPGPYNEPDIRQMELFMGSVWKMVVRQRAEEALAQALRDKEALVKKLEESEAALRDRNEKMEFDLSIAQSAQKSIIRTEKPESDRIRIEYRYMPMERVGGDYFSFYKSGEGSISFFIGDVSGHGISAALFIALLKSITDRVFVECGDKPDEYLRRVNDGLVDYLQSNFITAIYGIFISEDEGGMRLRYANGAHIKPIVMRAGGECTFNGGAGTLIGVSDGMEFEVNEVNLGRGDRVFVLTDGIPEAANQKKEIIGFEDELTDLFCRSRDSTLAGTIEAAIEDVTVFRNGLPQQDDITLIGFEVL